MAAAGGNAPVAGQDEGRLGLANRLNCPPDVLRPFKIHVRAEAGIPSWEAMLSALESFLPVTFEVSKGFDGTEAGELMIGSGSVTEPEDHHTRVTSLSLSASGVSSPNGRPEEAAITFSSDSDVPRPFRGKSLRVQLFGGPQVLAPVGRERVLASHETGPVWTVSEAGGVKHFRSGLGLPRFAATGSLCDVLNGDLFIGMLPLLHWLRELCASRRFDGPPLRACFVFDDPNLHWPRYGFVDFREIAAHAARENYHVSFATIPLDAWFTHKGTAGVFRSNATRLSLAIHGNDHTRQELAQNYTEAERASLLQQAVRRIERLERQAGVQVSRVMVPPHGACSHEMLGDLPRWGFEAACISHGSLRAHNEARPWTRTLGYLPAELIQGCPVLPRWALAGNTANLILLSAYLNQPIILRGHHQDLKEGVELLDQLANAINGLGPVLWSSLGDISRANFQWRMDGTVCRVKPLGRRIDFPIPASAEQLVVESPSNSLWENWQITGSEHVRVSVTSGAAIPLPETLHGVIAIEAVPARPTSTGSRLGRPVATAVGRRMLTEMRDRFFS
jgi:hypothetical protein